MLDEAGFWNLIAKLDWTDPDRKKAVLRPLVEALAKQPEASIEAFEELLARKLYALDTEAHARNIGEDSYVGPNQHFSVDWFLYTRCRVVASGQRVYESVLRDPKQMPKDQGFEGLLYVAGMAFQKKTGKELPLFNSSCSYETFSNKAGWK